MRYEPERRIRNVITVTSGLPAPIGDIIAVLAFGGGFELHFELRSVHRRITDGRITVDYSMTLNDLHCSCYAYCSEPDIDFYTTDFKNPELDKIKMFTLLCTLPSTRLPGGGFGRRIFRVCGGTIVARHGFLGARIKTPALIFSDCTCIRGACVCVPDGRHLCPMCVADDATSRRWQVACLHDAP